MYNYIRKVVKEYLVAIYIRLSKEDDNLGESESVGNQKLLLTKYVKEQGYTLVDIYIDDGYTGTNFNRPNFQRMLKDIEIGKVNMVITKDLSRLSRDYIGTGEYVEKWFPAHNVRYVALTDNVDTFLDNSNNDIAPFKAILNDMYAKDLSKKIRTALHTMQCEGKWVGGCPPFGYKVDPNDKNHLVIDEVEAPIVKRIFNMFASGIRINKIRDTFNNENVPTFSTTRNRNFTRNGSNGNIYGYWCNTTIKKILQNRLYTGDMIQNKRFRLSYKYRKIVCNPQENWIIVENTHEPIIDKNIFNKVQSLLPKQQQRNDKKELFLLDGLLKCAECGHNIGIRARRANLKSTTVCNYYRKYSKELRLCTSHGFDYDTLEQGVVNEIKKVIYLINSKQLEEEILKRYKNNNIFNTYNKAKEKLKIELDNIKNSLDNMYIDRLENKITEELYQRVQEKFNKEISLKKNELNKINNYLDNISKDEDIYKKIKKEVLEFKDRYPTRDLILKLIKNISIHEDGNIDIYFNFKELNFIYNKHVAWQLQPEGIATFLSASTNKNLGLSLALAISFHNIPEGISTAIPIYFATKDRKKAFLYTFISGFSEPVGSIIAYLFLTKYMNNLLMGILLSFIAGLMIHIATFELLKESISYKRYKRTYFYLLIGIFFMLFSLLLTS